ncbi:MAG: 2-oxoacid:ferredoxin oxidoreductase subunit beta [Alphaproteobacteria bacterium]|jgi:2-oxoglutarate ferredoxin oxidoreductase subunit beta|nr:2-oxoacid:ferredoxin oxidoreductase subunit beta [Alphaproteobacteria bacterium]
MNAPTVIENLKPKDFASDQEVRWCPGCGDYAIIKGVQRTLAEIGARPENTVFVSGIGCSSRFPYYMETYGFHTIHGRAPAIATGVKLANPELDVWVVTGDGDGLSIGGNHMLHALRRNVDLQILLFNNEIYGLTKGQYSPTSRRGTRSPSTPMGSVDLPLSPAQMAIGAGGRFVARGVDTQQKELLETLKLAHAHNGTSFIEIFQNCIVYNDGVFDSFAEKSVAADRQIHVNHGQPLRFGKDGNRGLRLNAEKLALEAVTVGEDGVAEDDILVHDESSRPLALMLAAMEPPEMPMAMGVLYSAEEQTYEDAAMAQVEAAIAKSPEADVNALLRSGATWTV